MLGTELKSFGRAGDTQLTNPSLCVFMTYFSSTRPKKHTGPNLNSCPRSNVNRRQSLGSLPLCHIPNPGFRCCGGLSQPSAGLTQPLILCSRQISNLRVGQRESIPLGGTTKIVFPTTTFVPGCVHICIRVYTCMCA